MWGLFGGLGALIAVWIALMVVALQGVLVLIVVALFLAVGLNPAVEFLMRRVLCAGRTGRGLPTTHRIW